MIWVFWISAAFVAYTIAGWPMLLGLSARFFARAIRREFSPRTVSVIIAVHNGERYLRAKLESVLALDYPKDLMQILVVSDGSTDATDSIAEEFEQVRLIRAAKGGKCRAVNTAIPQATGEILFMTDVRQALEPDCLRKLVACYADPKVGVVSGELRIHRGATEDARDVGLYWRFETWIRNRLSDLDSMFGATGPVYSIRRELAVRAPEEILLDDMYIPLSAFFKGYRLVVEPQAVAWDVPTSRRTEFQRKVRTLAGNYQLLSHYPQLVSPLRNRMWLHYVSYKLARLLLPWAFAALFVSSFFLPQPWNFAVVGCQAFCYLMVRPIRIWDRQIR